MNNASLAALAIGVLWVVYKTHNKSSPPPKEKEKEKPKKTRTTPQEWLAFAVTRMKRCVPPRQSNFRVYAILTWTNTTTGETGWVSGTNSESAYIGGSLCAERAAAVQLRELDVTCKVTAVYLCSDLLNSPITPGVLCREYLLSCVDPDVPVWLTTADNSIIRQTSLRTLYPFPSIFEGVDRQQLVLTARDCCNQVTKCLPAGELWPCTLTPSKGENTWSLMITKAIQAAKNDTLGGSMHPVRYGACMEFSDGSFVLGWQTAGLEYGTTLDAVTSMLREMEAKCNQSSPTPIYPVRLVQVDQFGNLHAPFAPARAQLFERDYGKLLVGVDDRRGIRKSVALKLLVPDCPKMSEIWS
jgi:cytidine deaminase